jgi:tetratricopeptide (TPR) repeat protein
VRADFMLHDRHYTEAQEMLEQALRLDPKLASAYESMGLLYSHQGKATEAGKWYSEALALESKSYLAHYYYAINLLKSGFDEDAIAKVETSLRTALKINPDFAPAYNSLAHVLLLSSHSQNLDEAYMLTLHAIELEPGNALYWITSARALQRLGRVNDAQRAAKLAVSMAKTPNERAEAAAALTSIQQFQSRPKPGQNSNGTSDGAYFFYKEALAAARAGNYAEAANGLKQLLELEPAHSSARNELGRIYLRQDQLDLAAASFRKQIEMIRPILTRTTILGSFLNDKKNGRRRFRVFASNSRSTQMTGTPTRIWLFSSKSSRSTHWQHQNCRERLQPIQRIRLCS